MDVVLLLVVLYWLALLITGIMSWWVDEPIIGLSKTNGGQSDGRMMEGSPLLSAPSIATVNESSYSSLGANSSLSPPCHLKRERRRLDFTEEEGGKLGNVPYINTLHN